jgi:uroporphyrinogen decarboxylase
VGFIIDSPWLPNWYGISILDYFTSDELWLKANLYAVEAFPEAMFLPGFWSEYGMCTEPSAFGAGLSFPPDEFPHAFPMIKSVDQIASLRPPHPEKDGLGPLVLNRIRLNEVRINDAGHRVRFSVSRGPLNIACYLMEPPSF